MSDRARVLVIGGGIAGVAAAYALAGDADVTLAERESTLAYHTTGRSAALLFENYGAPAVRPLTKASRPFFDSPPVGLADHRLLSPRGALTIARGGREPRIDELEREGVATGTKVERLTTAEAQHICPALRPEAAAAALWEPDAADMDVAGIHQAFVRGIRRRHGTITTSAEVLAASPGPRGWVVDLTGGRWCGDAVINAAGAWGDVVAARCGVTPIGLEPKRRTAFMVKGSGLSASWPLVVEADHDFYFKPDGGQILCSLADETPSEPVDARPEELDVALAIERINQATTLAIRSVSSQWAGLRTFAADGGMVIGPDPVVPEFVWLVGQGGTGIQTAPAAGALAAALTLRRSLPASLAVHGVDPVSLGPARFRTG